MSKFKIIAINNILQAEKAYQKEGSQFIYSPIVFGKAQKEFHEKRFLQIQKRIKSATLKLNSNQSFEINNKVYAWDAWNEKSLYKTNIVEHSQNRLLSELNFEIPDSFTNFRKRVEKKLPDFFCGAIEPFDEDVRARLKHYFFDTNLPSTYFETRNGMVQIDDSSRFSPFLSCGALDVKWLYNEIKKYETRNGSNKSTYWLIFELLWREFFYWHYQKWGCAYFSSNGINGDSSFLDFDVYTIKDLKKMSYDQFWQCALAELDSTGFQTNRTRQLFASFWIHELELDWKSGAKLFEDHLIDYDVYSNWGNWMYLAGVGVDSRSSRRFNIASQLERYDPKGEYFAKWS